MKRNIDNQHLQQASPLVLLSHCTLFWARLPTLPTLPTLPKFTSSFLIAETSAAPTATFSLRSLSTQLASSSTCSRSSSSSSVCLVRPQHRRFTPTTSQVQRRWPWLRIRSRGAAPRRPLWHCGAALVVWAWPDFTVGEALLRKGSGAQSAASGQESGRAGGQSLNISRRGGLIA